MKDGFPSICPRYRMVTDGKGKLLKPQQVWYCRSSNYIDLRDGVRKCLDCGCIWQRVFPVNYFSMNA